MSEALAIPPAALPDELEALKASYVSEVAESTRLRHQVEFLQEQLRLMLHQRFGHCSEQRGASPQLSLFNAAEQTDDVVAAAAPPTEPIEVPAHTRPHGGRLEFVQNA